ncbi:partner of Y14 and mago-like isoform X2 [Varroa jacobsoni]|uniref:Partner of Y14 and mago n=1 Tax=Varroa destructor TaxID=109461 RepID=A0A7M7KYL6_VARDE|nr:partner of Y14 and mago-like isoform X2 [Varroa destructor]XP_022698093.1 partner of Y14 and mago-like isoform X2 [Varroa jacobsoni]
MSDPGSYIPASQRPDGTWRKARRVKEGYIPQDEVPKYESRGRQLARAMKPEFPPGLTQAEIEKQKRKQWELANPELAKAQNGNSKKKKNKKKSSQQDNNNSCSKENNVDGVHESRSIEALEEGILTLGIRGDETSVVTLDDNGTEKPSDLTKRLRALRKKIREIDSLQERIDNGECQPNKEQTDKVQRKADIENEIRALEIQQQELTAQAS